MRGSIFARVQRARDAHGATIVARKAGLERHPTRRIRMGMPRDTLLACRAGDYLPLPIHDKLGFIKARPLARLPTRGPSATGPMIVTPYSRSLSTSICASVYP